MKISRDRFYTVTMNKKERFQIAFSNESIFVNSWHKNELKNDDYPIIITFYAHKKDGIKDGVLTFSKGYDNAYYHGLIKKFIATIQL